MTELDTQQHGYLRWIVASDYYDGAMEGIGERSSDGAVVWFRAVAWDDEQWQRVFAVTRIEPALTQRLITELEKAGLRRLPFWLPDPSCATSDTEAAWRAVVEAALMTDQWCLAEAHDLLKPASERPAGDLSETVRVAEAVRSCVVVTVSVVPMIDDLFRYI